MVIRNYHNYMNRTQLKVITYWNLHMYYYPAPSPAKDSWYFEMCASLLSAVKVSHM